MALKLILYDRWENLVGEVPAYEATHRQIVNGEDTLTFSARVVLSDNDRVLWDDNGLWREHVINGIEQQHKDGETCSYTCESSLIWDLQHKQIRYAKWDEIDAGKALGYLLELVPLWNVGEVDIEGTHNFEFQKCSVYDALGEMIEAFECEFEPVITVEKNGVTSRKINLRKEIGNDSGVRIDYQFGLDSIKKETLEDYFFTACYGYGQSNGEGESGMLWCYVVNEEAEKLWGTSDGRGGMSHTEGFYENPDCTDLEQLEKETIDYLNDHSAPAITYTVEAPMISLYGVRNGDRLEVVDKDFSPPVRLTPRMTEMERNLMTGEVTSASFGTFVSVIPDVLARAHDAAARSRMELDSFDSRITEELDEFGNRIADIEGKQGELGDKSIADQLADLEKRLSQLEGGG